MYEHIAGICAELGYDPKEVSRITILPTEIVVDKYVFAVKPPVVVTATHKWWKEQKYEKESPTTVEPDSGE